MLVRLTHEAAPATTELRLELIDVPQHEAQMIMDFLSRAQALASTHREPFVQRWLWSPHPERTGADAPGTRGTFALCVGSAKVFDVDGTPEPNDGAIHMVTYRMPDTTKIMADIENRLIKKILARLEGLEKGLTREDDSNPELAAVVERLSREDEESEESAFDASGDVEAEAADAEQIFNEVIDEEEHEHFIDETLNDDVEPKDEPRTDIEVTEGNGGAQEDLKPPTEAEHDAAVAPIGDGKEAGGEDTEARTPA